MSLTPIRSKVIFPMPGSSVILQAAVPINVGAVCASKGMKVKTLEMLGEDDPTTSFLISEMKRLNMDVSDIEIRKDVTNGKVLIILTGDKRTMFVIDPIRPHYEVTEKMQGLLNKASVT